MLPDAASVRNHVLQKTIGGLTFILPGIPDERVIGFAERYVSRIKYPDGRDFVNSLMLQTKNKLPQMSKNVKKGAIDFITNSLFVKNEARERFRKENGFAPPILIVISPTMKCNLKCYGCYAGMYPKTSLDFETVDSVVSEIKEAGTYFITISGGEPFFWPHLFEITEKHNDMMFQIYTNGTLIDMNTAKRISESGNMFPCISVEGFEAETDMRRGSGSFKKIMEAMDNLNEQGAVFGISVTATRKNTDLVLSDDFIDFYFKKGTFLAWYFQYMPVGENPDLDLVPTPEQRIYRLKRLREMRQKKLALASDFWNDGALVGGCISAGRCYLHINSQGDVEPCVFCHFAVDNIKEKSVRDVLKSPFFEHIRGQQPYSENLLRPCMIIDTPDVLRDAVNEHDPKPTNPNAEKVLNEFAPYIDEMSRTYERLADAEWENYTQLTIDRSETA